MTVTAMDGEAGRAVPRLTVFGGLGSLSLFSSSTTSAIRNAIAESPAASLLASKCHESLLTILRSLSDHEIHSVSLSLDDFVVADDFLYPAPCYHNHAIIELTTLCLYQLVYYLGQKANTEYSFMANFERVQECVGFCAGLLPATVVSCSSSVEEFLTYAKEAFCLSFWIGYRSILHLYPGINARSKHKPCSLAIFNASQAEIEESITSLYLEESSISHPGALDTTQYANQYLRISVVSTNFVSVSGPNSDLEALKQRVGEKWPCRFTSVHGWYHGGNELSGVVSKVEADIGKYHFPTKTALKKPLRSTLDGVTAILAPGSADCELVPWILQHMLIHCVNWSDVLVDVLSSYRQAVENQLEPLVEVESFGPGTDSLVACIQQLPWQSCVGVRDLSPFKSDSPLFDQRNSIAIVGMGFLLPSGSSSEELWNNLYHGRTTVQTVPTSRFDVGMARTRDSSKGRQPLHGSFLGDIWKFDHEFFGISPREAKSMDPQQRLLLHTAQRAFEDAGYVPDSTPSFQRKSMGCYVGLATGDYEACRGEYTDVYHSPGTLRAFHSGRISYFYRLGGPCMTTDTACSSSAVSIYQACRALQNHECTAAIAGGINLICGPEMFVGLDNAHFLSKTGTCKPFDQSADGYGRAEGCTLFILKRLSDAIAENDRVHAVIKDAMINQSGCAQSITHPSQEAQEGLFKGLLERAKVPPATVSVIEAHGTGTQAGDVCEMASIHNVFNQHRSALNPLSISSIKGNLGHCEAASGGAGLVKLVLMLRNKTILKQAGYTAPNPKIADKLTGGSLIIPKSNQAWKSNGELPRRSMLNNFGAAGSNCALLVEEAMPKARSKRDLSMSRERSSYTFVVSAQTRESLAQAIDAYKLWLQGQTSIAIKDLCYTVTARRQQFRYSLAVPCSNKANLISDLCAPMEEQSEPPSSLEKLVFVFSGQGATQFGMGKELFQTSSLFRRIILQCDQIVQALGCPSITAYVDGETPKPLSPEQDVIASQCACVALEFALAKLLMSWSLQPDCVIGHSIGEYSALAVAGVVSIDQIMRFTALRARAVTRYCRPNYSGMTSCTMASSRASLMLERMDFVPHLSIACKNGKKHCVIAGPRDQLTMFERICVQEGIHFKRLNVPYGFHSAAMDPIMHELDELTASLTWSRPQIPLISCVTGDFFRLDDSSAKDYFSLHTRGSVLFGSAVELLEGSGILKHGLCLEIGPHPILIPMIRSSATIGKDSILATLQRDKLDWSSLSVTLSKLVKRNCSINWREVYDSSDAQVIDCPGYQLGGSPFEAPLRNSTKSAVIHEHPVHDASETGLHLLPNIRLKDDECTFTTTMEILEPRIVGHNVRGTPICPASVFLELSLLAGQFLLKPSISQTVVVRSMNFHNPLVPSTTSSSQLIGVCVIMDSSRHSMDIQISSINNRGKAGRLYCSANAALQSHQALDLGKRKSEITFRRQNAYMQQMPSHLLNHLTKKSIYDLIFPRVVSYSTEFQCLLELTLSECMDEGTGVFKIPITKQKSKSHLSILWYDTLFHTTGFMANIVVPSEEVCICVAVDAINIISADIDFEGTWSVYSDVLDLGDGYLTGDAVAIGPGGEVAAQFQGLKFKKIPAAAFQRTLQGLSKGSTVPSPELPEEPMPPRQIPSISEPDTVTTCPTPATSNNNQSIRESLSEIICQVTGLPKRSLDPSTNLKRLGIDSMMEIELAPALQMAFPGSMIDHYTISGCNTVGDLEATVTATSPSLRHRPTPDNSNEQSEQGSSTIASYNELAVGEGEEEEAFKSLQLNPALVQSSQSGGPPLVLFHDGSGTITAYTRIKNLERDVYAFHDPRLRRNVQAFQSLFEMANEYVTELLRTGMDSVMLGGWSFGGVLAFEVARQLVQTNIRVKGLVLIDSPFPMDHNPIPEKIVRHVLKNLGSEPKSSIINEFLNNARLLEQYNLGSSTLDIKVAILHCQDEFDTEALCGLRYTWLCDPAERQKSLDRWQQLSSQGTRVIPILGHHFDVFNSTNIEHTSAQLRAACDFLEAA